MYKNKKLEIMRKLAVILIAFIAVLCAMGSEEPTTNELQDSRMRMHLFMESSAKSSLNYKNTYEKESISVSYNVEENRIYGVIHYSGKNAFGISKNYVGKISVNLNKDFTINSNDKTSKFVIN
tara:strand:- start:50 stop:418 length:369 start_codon:yes stop_codon:yes gene_type:complete